MHTIWQCWYLSEYIYCTVNFKYLYLSNSFYATLYFYSATSQKQIFFFILFFFFCLFLFFTTLHSFENLSHSLILTLNFYFSSCSVRFMYLQIWRFRIWMFLKVIPYWLRICFGFFISTTLTLTLTGKLIIVKGFCYSVSTFQRCLVVIGYQQSNM